MPIIGFGGGFGGGGGTSYINGVVPTSADLPTTVGNPPTDSVYLAKVGSGVWLINRKPAGLYVRVANNGNLNDWTYLGAFPEVNADGNWELYNTADPTKELKFSLSGISTATTRTLTAPNASGTISLQGHTHVSADITDATSDETPNTIVKRDGYGNAKFNGIQVTDVTPPLGEVWLAGFDDSGTVAAISPAEARDFIGLDTDNNVTFGSLQNTPIGSTTKSTGSFTTLSAAPTSGSALTLTGGTVTASAPLIDATQTWNASGTAFTALRVNVTATAAAANSMLSDFQVGGYSYFGLSRISSTSNALWLYNTNSGTNTNGIGANYERGFLRWSSNILQIGTEKLGTGSRRTLEFVTDGTARWRVGDGSISSSPSMLALGNTAIFGTNEAYNVIIATGAQGTTNAGIFSPNTSNTGYLAIGESLHLGLLNNGSSGDVRLVRDAANVLALRNGASTPQAYRIYNTFASTTSFERLNIRWASNECIIDAEAGSGGGTLRGIRIGSATTSLLGFYNATAIAQPSSVGTATTGYTANGPTNTVHADSTFTGSVGTTAYNISDIVKHLKNLGLIAS